MCDRTCHRTCNRAGGLTTHSELISNIECQLSPANSISKQFSKFAVLKLHDHPPLSPFRQFKAIPLDQRSDFVIGHLSESSPDTFLTFQRLDRFNVSIDHGHFQAPARTPIVFSFRIARKVLSVDKPAKPNRLCSSYDPTFSYEFRSHTSSVFRTHKPVSSVYTRDVRSPPREIVCQCK